MRIAIFGDLSGWAAPFYDALERLGVDLATEVLPDDLAIVQVGDLIHKGPDSDELVAFADRMTRGNGGRWRQLVGNHEAHHLGGPMFSGGCTCTCTEPTLEEMVVSGRMQIAAALRCDELGDLLVTHAGVTVKVWRELGSPRRAADVADALNAAVRGSCRAEVFSPGLHLSGWGPSSPGPVWAIAAEELYPSWAQRPMPFSQAHGHTSPVWWGRPMASPLVIAGMPATADTGARHVYTRHSSGTCFVSLDPAFGRYQPTRPLVPLVVEGAFTA